MHLDCLCQTVGGKNRRDETGLQIAVLLKNGSVVEAVTQQEAPLTPLLVLRYAKQGQNGLCFDAA